MPITPVQTTDMSGTFRFTGVTADARGCMVILETLRVEGGGGLTTPAPHSQVWCVTSVTRGGSPGLPMQPCRHLAGRVPAAGGAEPEGSEVGEWHIFLESVRMHPTYRSAEV